MFANIFQSNLFGMTEICVQVTFCLILYMFFDKMSCILLTSAARNVFLGRDTSFLSSLKQGQSDEGCHIKPSIIRLYCT